MFRDLFIGSVAGILLYLWRHHQTLTGDTTPKTVTSSSLPSDASTVEALQQTLAQTQQELRTALENCATAETQIAELNQIATDRAIELIQLQAEKTDLLAQITALSQKQTRRKRSPKVESPVSTPTSIETETEAALPAPESVPFTLDINRIQAKQTESVAATQLLETVLVELPTPEIQTSHSSSELDTAHSTFLQYLGQQPYWSREALTHTAAQQNLLLDGALEVINEAAFDRCDEALTEGDDPIAVNLDILRELLS
jgi:chromosome segregation ATPase